MSYNIQNPQLQKAWSVHPGAKANKEFQRLEFLGDKIIALEITKILYNNPNINEGDLTNGVCHLVNQDIMAKIGQFLVPQIIYENVLSKRIIASCLEAWVAAVFLDGADISKIINDIWTPFIGENVYEKNHKNLIQEYAVKHGLHYSYYYELIQKENTINQMFKATLRLDNKIFIGYGTSKKHASLNAAEQAYKTVEKVS